MADKLSVRLEAARSCQGEISYDAMDAILREAVELARRVEGATMVEWNHRAGIVRPDLYGQRVHLVPEPPEVG